MSIKKHLDLFIYFGLVGLLLIYALSLRANCEGIGCLAVVIPIIGIMIITVAEWTVNLVLLATKKKFTLFRKILFVLLTIGTLFSISTFMYAYFS